MIVVDASLAVKWMLWESDSLAALAFLRRHNGAMAAPTLILSEVAGAFVRRGNENSAPKYEMLDLVSEWTVEWQKGALHLYELSRERVLAASKLALELGHPLKDSLYLALAIELGCPLATCDVRFRDRAVRVYPDVRLLAELTR